MKEASSSTRVLTQLREQLPLILEDAENGLTDLTRELFAEQYEKIKALDAEIKAQDQRINRLCNANDLSKRFLEVPGVGPLTATIVAADIGDSGKGYKSSRDYAASLGVVPNSTVVLISSIIWGSVNEGTGIYEPY